MPLQKFKSPMIDLEPSDADRMSKEDFVALATEILDLKGTDTYEDEWVAIRRNYNGLALEIERQAQDVEEGHRRSHLRASNPTTMVTREGEIIRHHGEYIYIAGHMKNLLTTLR
jgi:hypothetical protein